MAAGVVFLLVAGGGYFLFFQKSSPEPVKTQENIEEEVVIPTLTPQQIGLAFIARSDKRAVKFSLTEVSDITSIDYEISYTAKGDIPRGAIGHIDIKPTDGKTETNYIDLGTCSSGKCKYDEGVESVKLFLKIAKNDGKNYSVEDSLNF